MNKRLLIGPAGSGKTHRMLEEFKAALNSSEPLAGGVYYLLPSAEHTERIITLLASQGLKGFFFHRITTLSRLLEEVFDSSIIPTLSSPARFLLLKNLFEENSWDYFKGISLSPGFLGLLGGFIQELKESLISVEVFRERMNALKRLAPEMALKYEALAGIYEAYETRLKNDGFRDRQDALLCHPERSEGSRKGILRSAQDDKRKKYKKIFLDGFFDFSRWQIASLELLSSLTEEMTISLTKDPAPAREGLFSNIQKTEEALQEMGFKLEVLKPENYRTKKPGLIHLERNIFKEGSDPGVRPPQHLDITIFESAGMQGEMEMAAREMIRKIRSGKYRASDFAILLRHIGPYEPVIRSVFGRYGIPVEIHERKRLSQSPWSGALQALLGIFQNGWQRKDLLAFLKSVDSQEFIFRFEFQSLREGVFSGRDQWLREWKVNDGGVDLAEFNKKKTELLTPLAELEDRLKSAKTFQEIEREFRAGIFCHPERSEGSRDPSAFGLRMTQGQPCPPRNDELLIEAASRRRFNALLREMELHFHRKGKSEALSFDTFANHFLKLVEIDLYSIHLPHKNCVQVYDVSLARQKEYKVVFVSGLLEKSFPVILREDAVLSDWERRLFNGASAEDKVKLEERLPRQDTERYLFYLALTRVSEELFLTTPRFDREGREALPSFYIDEVQSLFEGSVPVVRERLAEPYPSFETSVNTRELELAVVGGLWHAPAQEENLLLSLMNKLLENVESRKKFHRAFSQIQAHLSDPRIREGNFFRTNETSATKLEEYAKCPYRYFAHRVLGLQDPIADENAMVQGRILHEVLEHCFKERVKRPRNFLKPEAAKEFILREFESVFANHTLIHERRYRLDLDREMLKETLLRFMDFELDRLETSAFLPRYFEYNFGVGKNPDSPALELNFDGETVKVVGKIDRIDVDAAHETGLVMDYKTAQEFKRPALEFGTALQLPLYLLAMEKYLKLKPAGAELYSLKKTRKTGFYHKENAAALAGEISSRAMQLTDGEYQNLISRSLAFIQHFVNSMKQLEIPVKPRDCDKYCSYSSVCRIEKWKLPLIEDEIRKEDAERFKVKDVCQT